MINYIQPGKTLGHGDWDAFYAEADAKMATSLSSQAAALTTALYERRFYFMPRPASTTDWSSLGEAYASLYLLPGNTGFGIDNYARFYDHGPFTSIVNSLPLATPVSPDMRPAKDDKWLVARLESGDLTTFTNTWAPLIWPDAANPAGSPAIEALQFSLECHTRIFADDKGVNQKYNVYIDQSTSPEYIQRWTPVDIILGEIGSTFVFPDNYNKYNVFRFSNIQGRPVTVQFGAGASVHHSVVIPAMQSRCVRRTSVSGTYTDGYKYFQKPMAGDPWFLNWKSALGFQGNSAVPPPGTWSNITDVMCGSYLATRVAWSDWNGDNGFVGAMRYDVTKAWDPSSIYNNPNRSGGKFELPTPSGGWYPAISEGAILGDLAFHRGKLVLVDPAGDFLVWRTQPFTVDAISEQHTLKKEDGTIALGVQNVSVKRESDGSDIPELSGGDRNWLVGSVTDSGGNPISFYIVFTVRTAGGDPKLAAGDKAQVRFRHKTDDHRQIIEFEGMGNLVSKLADVGITVDMTPSFPDARDFTLKSDPPRDLISVSSNLILAAFNQPGKTIGDGTNGFDGITFPYFSFLNTGAVPLTTRIITTSQERTVKYWDWQWDGSNYVNVEQKDSSPWQNHYRDLELVTLTGAAASYFDTVGSLLTQFRGFAEGGDALTTVSMIMTGFGPKIVVTQTMNTAYPCLFDLMTANFDLRFPTGSTIPFITRQQFMSISPLNAGIDSSFGWPQFDGNEFGSGTQLGIELGAMRRCYPRLERRWANKRFCTHKPDEEPFIQKGTTADVISSEHPLVKSFYEPDMGGARVPFDDARLLPVASSKSNASTGIGLLGSFGPGEYDIWARFSAWLNYSIITFKAPGGDVVFDFSKGAPWQSAYYGIERANILAGTPGDGDGIGPNGVLMVEKQLPISAEDFNASASALNCYVSRRGCMLTDLQFQFFKGLGQRIGLGGQTGFGLGAYYNTASTLFPRPRDQWVGWDVEQNPGIEEFFQRIGCPVKGRLDFPTSSLDAFMNANMLCKVWGLGGITTEIIPFSDPPSTVKMADTPWCTYLFGLPDLKTLNKALDNYRWVSITDAIPLHQRLGVPFIYQELSVPMFLHVADAGWIQLDSRPGVAGTGDFFTFSRAANWVNGIGGDWLVDNDANGEIGARIMNEHEPTDYCIFEETVGDQSVLFDAAYPDGLEKRFYGNAPFVPITQADVANEFYCYRNYGGMKAYAIIYPRNYAAYAKNFNNSFVKFEAPGSPFENRPRNVNNGLEGGNAQVIEMTEGDNVIGASVPNGEVVILQAGKDL